MSKKTYSFGPSEEELVRLGKPPVESLAKVIVNAVAREPRCHNCKHWGSKGDGWEGLAYRDCQAIEHDCEPWNKLLPPVAATADYEGRSGISYLRTQASFGCVLFEAKEQT